MKSKAKPPQLYGWSARGVKGNPVVQTYLPLLNSYGGNFVNDDWSPGFAGPEGVGALERLLSFLPYMSASTPEFDTDQETALLLQGKCMALTEYTGTAVTEIDNPADSKVVGKIDMAPTPVAGQSPAPPSAPSSAVSPRARPTPRARSSSWSGSPATGSRSSSPARAAARR